MSVISEFKQILSKYGLEYFNKHYSIYPGVVEDNQDPKCLGRLIVRVPQIHGRNVPSQWALPCGFFMGSGVGSYMIPGKGDNVRVMFECGNPSYPLWTYGNWAEDETPEAAKETKDRSKIYIIQTQDKSRLEFNTEEKYIRLFRSDGKVIEVNDKNISLGSLTKSEYHALLGEIVEEVIEELRVDIDTLQSELSKYATTQISAATSVAVLAPLIAGYSPLLTAMQALAGTLVKLQKKIPTIKSDLVTLDK